nr:translation initiation factor eIF-2B subunit epsilon-like isoform X2 [Ciona intestinalis]|eukprot:XP_018670398.1 translation initiation factor eIF-2B subunit epsilon-like isoform X2 [Ciona intestinalis]
MSGKRKKEVGIKQENILEAVVLADSFNKRFYPVTENRPRCLFPVANQPLISYTLEFLSICGVKHIYVYACHCLDQVKQYILQSKWANTSSPCKVTIVSSQDLTSVGDVLRDVDQKNLFETDFLIVPGDIVSNLKLSVALEEHRNRREKDKNSPLMTLVLRSSSPAHRSRTPEDNIAVALDLSSNRVLHYHRFNKAASKVNFPLNILQDPKSRVELRYDLTDTGIWVCSPQVPQLFTDNFDYQTQYDLIKGVLINEEFLGNQIHAHVANSRYCSRVYNFHSYDVVSHDILSRWTHPFVPEITIDEPIENCKSETNCFLENYSLLRHNLYLHNTCTLGKNSQVLDCSLIGRGTKIGNRCKITNSVIGNGCTIEDDCVIDGSYIWDGVKIGCQSTITKSFICDSVQVYSGVMVNQGCVLCDSVHVGPKIDLESGTVVHLSSTTDDFDDGEPEEVKPYDIAQLGDQGKGYVWEKDNGSETGSDASLVLQMWGLSLQEHNKKLQDHLLDVDGSESETSSMDSADEDEQDPIMDDDLTTFQREVKESLCGGIEENIQSDNLVLEINSSKYAYNMSVKDVVQTVTKSLLEIATEKTANDPTQYFTNLKMILTHYVPLLLNYNKNGSSQLDCIYSLEGFALNSEATMNCLVKVLMFLYENDVLSEEVILHWNSNPRDNSGTFSPANVREKVKKFIEWLEEAEEEDSEED